MASWRHWLCDVLVGLLLAAGLAALLSTGQAGAAALPSSEPERGLETVVADDAIYQVVPTPVDDVVTIVSRLEFPDEQHDIETFLLGGFAVDEAGVPVNLAVRWRRDGWFQLWTLGVESDLGVLPSSLTPGSRALPGHRTLTLEAGKFPEAGHVYETTLSYAPRTGYLAVSVVDLTAEESFYRNVIQLEPVNLPVYPGAGLILRSKSAGTEQVAGPQITRWLSEIVPAGVRWRVMERIEEDRWFPTTFLDRSMELALEVEIGRGTAGERAGETEGISFPGELRFVARSPATGDEIALAAITGSVDTIRIPIDAERLPAGYVDVSVEYVRDEEVLFTDERRFAVGVVHVAAEPLRPDAETERVSGAIAVRVDGPMDDFALGGRIVAEARSLVEPTTELFEERLNRVISPGRRLLGELEPVEIRFEFPMPPEVHKWTVGLDVAVEAPEGVRVHMEVPNRMSVITGPADAPERILQTVIEQYFEEFLLPGTLTLTFPSPREDGSWSDIDYADQSVGGWKAVPHLDRVLHMARAYAHPQSVLRGSKELRDDIVRALRFWVEVRPRNPNWWWNVIWQPQRLGDITLLMGEALPDELFDAALEIMRAEVLYGAPGGGYTGANLVWNEGNRLRIGLITRDLGMVSHAFDAMVSEVQVMSFGKEGIQVDGSFHQHGAMLYNGGYGESFLGDLVRFAYVARGTALFSSEALSALVDYILDGQQWMVRGLTFDFSSTGRVLSRQQASGNARYLTSLVRTLASFPGIPRKDELDAFFARLHGSGEQLSGNRYFWTSDFMTHHRPEFYVSLKASSTRTLATEIGNYENLKGHHLGDGMMFIMRTGTEYDQTFPVWNWEQLPGTTVRHMEHQLLVDGSWLTVRGAGEPASGVSDGTYGAMAMHLKRDGFSARKSWFFFDREVVALGADIEAPAGALVTTSVNQTRLSGDAVVVGEGERAVALESETERVLDDPEWVYHDGVTYVFPNSGPVTVSNKMQQGRWSDINSVYSSQLLSIPVFSLWFDHSGSGRNEYAYIVAPGVQKDQAASYAKEHGVAVVANDSAVQAVWHDGIKQLQAVFWKAGAVAVPSGLVVTVDAPALLIIRESERGVIVTAGTLERRPGRITVRLEQDHADGYVAAEGIFTFPEGDELGRSVTLVLPIDNLRLK